VTMPLRSISLLCACLATSSALQLSHAARPAVASASGARCTAHSLPFMLLGMGGRKPDDVPRTVGDAKAAFQKVYGRPVSTLAQGFVSEMLTSVTLATVVPSYKYSRIFAVGFEALCDSFLVSIPTDQQRTELRDAMCTALELDGKQLKTDSDALKAAAGGMSEAELLAMAELTEVRGQKYSYPFGAGLLTLMPLVGAPPSAEVIGRWAEAVEMSSIRLEKDWMFFEKALKQMSDARQMMMEMQASAKRKEAKALKEKADKAAKAAAEAETEASGEKAEETA